MNYLKEIDKESVHCTSDLVPGLSLHKIKFMRQNQRVLHFAGLSGERHTSMFIAWEVSRSTGADYKNTLQHRVDFWAAEAEKDGAGYCRRRPPSTRRYQLLPPSLPLASLHCFFISASSIPPPKGTA